jgi:serine carboxypeptidase
MPPFSSAASTRALRSHTRRYTHLPFPADLHRPSQQKTDHGQTHICETTPGVKAFAGYITLPPTLDPEAANYTSHMFFWFFESRSDPATAPLTVWLQGGPGDASIDQAVGGYNGPCAVQADSRTTKLNPNSWNAKSNMLYIDQPALVGFTYDDIVPGVLNTLTWEIDVSPEGQNVPLNWTAIRGKFNSQNEAHSAHSTNLAARALVGFLDLWTTKCVESAHFPPVPAELTLVQIQAVST